PGVAAAAVRILMHDHQRQRGLRRGGCVGGCGGGRGGGLRCDGLRGGRLRAAEQGDGEQGGEGRSHRVHPVQNQKRTPATTRVSSVGWPSARRRSAVLPKARSCAMPRKGANRRVTS